MIPEISSESHVWQSEEPRVGSSNADQHPDMCITTKQFHSLIHNFFHWITRADYIHKVFFDRDIRLGSSDVNRFENVGEAEVARAASQILQLVVTSLDALYVRKRRGRCVTCKSGTAHTKLRRGMKALTLRERRSPTFCPSGCLHCYPA